MLILADALYECNNTELILRFLRSINAANLSHFPVPRLFVGRIQEFFSDTYYQRNHPRIITVGVEY